MKAVLYILYIQSKDASLSRAWLKLWSQSHPIPQQDGFSLSFKGEKNGVSFDRMRSVNPGLAETLQGLVAKFSFSDSKSCLFLMVSFLTEAAEEFSSIAQLKLCEALGSGGTVLFPRD